MKNFMHLDKTALGVIFAALLALGLYISHGMHGSNANLDSATSGFMSLKNINYSGK
jgi:hypothetical protein